MMNILLAPNSFKECASSVSITELLKLNLAKRKGVKFIEKPLSDGGDGFLSIYKFLYDVKPLIYLVKDNYGNYINKYEVLYNKDSRTIWIESANLFGLKSILKSNLNPLLLNSEVLGKLILMVNEDVLAKRLSVKSIYIGIGGTASIDFGMGACSQLGLELLDETGKKIDPLPKNFINVSSFTFNNHKLNFSIKCVVDVDTNLIGNPGAIEIYGKQKGANENDIKKLKSGIQNIIHLIQKQNKSLKVEQINGAGGGLAGGLNIFLNAEIIPAKDFITDFILKDVDPDKIDAIITGEGKLDYQTFEGKGVGVILELFKNKNIPIFIICGSADIPSNMKLPKNVFIINLIDMFNDLEESIKNYKIGIEKACAQIIKQLNK
jgi:glycerate kinase